MSDKEHADAIKRGALANRQAEDEPQIVETWL